MHHAVNGCHTHPGWMSSGMRQRAIRSLSQAESGRDWGGRGDERRVMD